MAIRKVEGFEDVMTTFITDATDPSAPSQGWGSIESPQSARTDFQGREQGNGIEDLLRIWNDERVEEYLHETWKESPVSRELEKLLSSIESTDDKTPKRKRERDDLDDAQLRAVLSSPAQGRYEYSIVRKGTVGFGTPQARHATTIQRPSDGFSPYKDAPPSAKRLRRAHTLPEPEGRQAPNQDLKLPTNTSQLLDLYFSHTHCWLPIVERHDILRVSYLYSENPARPVPSEKGSGVHATLWAILAYTNTQLALSMNVGSDQDGLSEQHPTSDDLYDAARNLIPPENTPAEIGHVQALIILALINVGQGKWTASWILVGYAVRLAIDLGLGRASSSTNGQARNREKHLFLGCFMIDTLISARLQRCPHLRREDAELAGLIDEDGLEEWDLWADNSSTTPPNTASGTPARRSPTFALSTFNRAIELYGILNDIIRDLSVDREGFCGQISQRLQLWHEKLPHSYRIDSDEQGFNPAMLPHQLYLYLGYFTTLIALHFHSHPHRKAFESPDRRSPEIFASLPCKIGSLLNQQAEAGRLAYLPPIYVFSVSLSIESGSVGRNNFGVKNLSFTEWMQQTFRSLSDLAKTWPVFAPLRQSLADEWQMGNESFLLSLADPNSMSNLDSSPFNEPNGLSSNQGGIWIPQQLPEPHSFETSLASASVNGRGSRTSVTDSLRTARASQSGPNLPPFSTPPDSKNDGSPLDHMTRSAYNADIWGIQNVGPTSSLLSSSLHNPQSNQFSSSTDDFDVDMSGLEQVHTNVTDISTMPTSLDDINFMTDDVDAIFRDLAHLDTTEWTNNREQGLKDFGFADDSTFRAFCNDPERLVTGNSFFQTSPSADLWPPNIGQEGAPDRHLEASQILQSLSSNDQYPMISEQRMGW